MFPSGSAMSVVAPSTLTHEVSEPFPSSLYASAVIASELEIHMILLAAKPESSTAQPAMQTQAQPPICLLARP